MAGFIMKQVVGSQLKEMTGGLSGGDDQEKNETGEDPEVIAAREEQERRRKDKHRKMEAEREKMRTNIRSKYNIHKKEDGLQFDTAEGRIGSSTKKTPEQLAAEMNADDDSIIGQLGLTEHVDKAKAAVTNAVDLVKGFFPFGK
uniref:Complexin-1 n=1 Tax=Rhabditophanes sp. KR3021 TaxID=114890 RepID=A0AC35UAB0_9BILA